jgi:hypothetical protein
MRASILLWAALLLGSQRTLCSAARPAQQMAQREAAAAPAAAPYAPKIPSDVNEWVYTDTSNLDSKHAGAVEHRFWDRAALKRATGAVNYEQMRPFLEKLNRGEPVTAVAFGDSITASHAGCFHRDEVQLRQHMKVLGSTYMRGHCAGSFKWHWAASFMSIINATWPHRGEQRAAPASPCPCLQLLPAARRRQRRAARQQGQLSMQPSLAAAPGLPCRRPHPLNPKQAARALGSAPAPSPAQQLPAA